MFLYSRLYFLYQILKKDFLALYFTAAAVKHFIYSSDFRFELVQASSKVLAGLL